VGKLREMENLGLIIFDLDGTLLDSMQLHATIFAQILHEQSGIVEELSREAYYLMSGNPLGHQFASVLKMQGLTRSHKVDVFVEEFYSRIRQFDPVLFPDVRPSLSQVSKAGYKLAVCSGNAPDIVEKRLVQTEIAPFFHLWLGTDPARGLSKGETQFRILREKLSLSRLEFQCNSITVGDAQHDIQVAKNAGILSVGRVNSFNAAALQEIQPDFLISNFYELVQLLQGPTNQENIFNPIASMWGKKN
jgi:phosphoglycolate phosphatase-like HAD superfamily hydrolase